jgi:hypothetical protein
MCKVKNLLRRAIASKSEVNQGERETIAPAPCNHPINMRVEKGWSDRVRQIITNAIM